MSQPNIDGRLIAGPVKPDPGLNRAKQKVDETLFSKNRSMVENTFVFVHDKTIHTLTTSTFNTTLALIGTIKKIHFPLDSVWWFFECADGHHFKMVWDAPNEERQEIDFYRTYDAIIEECAKITPLTSAEINVDDLVDTGRILKMAHRELERGGYHGIAEQLLEESKQKLIGENIADFAAQNIGRIQRYVKINLLHECRKCNKAIYQDEWEDHHKVCDREAEKMVQDIYGQTPLHSKAPSEISAQ